MPYCINLKLMAYSSYKGKDMGICYPVLYHIRALHQELPDIVLHLSQAHSSTTIIRLRTVFMEPKDKSLIYQMLNQRWIQGRPPPQEFEIFLLLYQDLPSLTLGIRVRPHRNYEKKLVLPPSQHTPPNNYKNKIGIVPRANYKRVTPPAKLFGLSFMLGSKLRLLGLKLIYQAHLHLTFRVRLDFWELGPPAIVHHNKSTNVFMFQVLLVLYYVLPASQFSFSPLTIFKGSILLCHPSTDPLTHQSPLQIGYFILLLVISR